MFEKLIKESHKLWNYPIDNEEGMRYKEQLTEHTYSLYKYTFYNNEVYILNFAIHVVRTKLDLRNMYS